MANHKILMMGGRRAGKSTILSSILAQLNSKTAGDICTFIDKTDYTQQIITKSGTVPLTPLHIKQNEIRTYLNNRQKNTEFLVDMSPTYGKASYTLEITSGKAGVLFEFVDVPGEWMRANVPEYAELKQLVEKSDVFIIAIDTPFLMNTDDADGASVNNVYNRINEITQAMTEMKIESECDLKQILLCPVKCERWVRNGQADEVVKKVKSAYRDLINRWVDHPEVTIQIMPIQTVGGFEHARFLPAQLYFKDDNERIGESCSESPLTGMLINKDGTILRKTESSRVEPDPFWTIDYVDIPLSWYKINEQGFCPKFSEQPGYHVLKFLVEKEENVIKKRADAERKKLDNSNILWRFFKILFKPTFGQYLPKWQGVIAKLSMGNYIKTDGDGFCYVKNKVIC